MVNWAFVFWYSSFTNIAITLKLKLVESGRYSRSSKFFKREHVFKWKSDKGDLLFHLFKGFILFKSRDLQFETSF